MINFSIGELEQDKQTVFQELKEKKKSGNFTIIDIGGWADGWSSEISDLIVDVNFEDTDKTMKLNVCQSLDKLLNYVDKHGKFDYCICSHTLEDLYNPYLLLDNFHKIAKAGIIMVPYFKTELSYIESNLWLGCIHHRYIFKQSKNTGNLTVIPKMPFLESKNIHNSGKANFVNFIIKWEGKIEYEIFMDNFLGPNVMTVFERFNEELELGLILQ